MVSKTFYEVRDRETCEPYYVWAWSSYGARREVSKENNVPEDRLEVIDVEERKLKEYVMPRYMAY